MVSPTIDERSLSQIRLVRSDRPFHIYFDYANTGGEQILLSSDGILYFDYYQRDLQLTIHSDSGPAIFFADGSMAWVVNGKYHRTDGPAVIDTVQGVHQYWRDGMHVDTIYEHEMLHSARLINDNPATNSPIFIARDGQTTVLSIADGGVQSEEKSDGSNADLFAVALTAFGTAGLLSILRPKLRQQKQKTNGAVPAAMKR
jgi:hypothetical protein